MRYVVLVAALLLTGCPDPKPAPSPGNDSCAVAEKKLIDLGCKDRRGRYLGGPTLRGKPWADVCRENALNGVDMKPDCIAQQPDCQGVSSCR